MQKFVASLLIVLGIAVPAFGKRVIPIWPDLKVPLSQRHPRVSEHGVVFSPVRWPTLTCYPAPAKINTGCAVVICPGGGYAVEVVGHEGVASSRWFNKIGVNCYVLLYRLQYLKHKDHHEVGKMPPGGVPWPLEDVRRAVQIVRAHASQWHLNPHSIGVMGFSAGGSVASLAGVHWLPGNPDARDPLNRFSTRPDFMVLCYPVISMVKPYGNIGCRMHLLGLNPPRSADEYFSSELNVNALTPPAFICYAANDPLVDTHNEPLFYKALRRNNIPAKIVEFKHGGHGFGIGKPHTGSIKWPVECEQWLKKLHFIPPPHQ